MKKLILVIELIVMLVVTVWVAAVYGSAVGAISLVGFTITLLFLNAGYLADHFSTLKVFQFEAKLNNTTEKTDKLQSFLLLYVKNELEALDTNRGIYTVLNGFSVVGIDKPSKHRFDFETPDQYEALLRIMKLVKVLDVSDEELSEMIFAKRIKILSEYNRMFDFIIKSYLDSFKSVTVEEVEKDYGIVPHLLAISKIIGDYSSNKIVNYLALNDIYKQLLSEKGDRDYLNRIWLTTIDSIHKLLDD